MCPLSPTLRWGVSAVCSTIRGVSVGGSELDPQFSPRVRKRTFMIGAFSTRLETNNDSLHVVGVPIYTCKFNFLPLIFVLLKSFDANEQRAYRG